MSLPDRDAQPPVSTREGQLKSAFGFILEQLCSPTAGALAAALVDADGETVDHAIATTGAWSPTGRRRFGAFDLRLTAAHWQLVARDAAAASAVGGTLHELRVATLTYGYLMELLPNGYVLLVVTLPERLQQLSSRAVRRCVVDLCQEAGWPNPRPEEPVWQLVKVRFTATAMPSHVFWQNTWLPVQGVPGSLGSGGLDRTYALQLGLGRPLRLACEPSGACYLEAPPKPAT